METAVVRTMNKITFVCVLQGLLNKEDGLKRINRSDWKRVLKVVNAEIANTLPFIDCI